MAGPWRVDGYLVPGAPDRQVSDEEKPWYLPRPGTTIIGRPGQLCTRDGDCQTFGLDRQSLANVPDSGPWAKSLHLAATAPFYVAYLDGKSAYGLIPRDGVLLALFNLCNKANTECRPAFQVWSPGGSDAAVRILAE